MNSEIATAAITILLTAGAILFVLLIRTKDVPQIEAESPVRHLEDRKAVIYENLRDVNFEYRLGKLSDADYQKTKVTLQNELAGVLAQMDQILSGGSAKPAARVAAAAKKQAEAAEQEAGALLQCPACGAKFEKPMKFCGECGKAMPEVKA